MSELYKKYVEGKNESDMTVGIVYAIRKGELIGSDAQSLIDELENRGKLNNATVDVVEKSKWNKDYLRLICNEVVGGTFSRQYLEYLVKVSMHVNSAKIQRTTTGSSSAKSEKSKDSSAANIIIPVVGISILVVGIIAVAVVSNGKNEKSNNASPTTLNYGVDKKPAIEKLPTADNQQPADILSSITQNSDASVRTVSENRPTVVKEIKTRKNTVSQCGEIILLVCEEGDENTNNSDCNVEANI